MKHNGIANNEDFLGLATFQNKEDRNVASKENVQVLVWLLLIALLLLIMTKSGRRGAS